MTLFKKQNRIRVVNHASRDIVVSDRSSGKSPAKQIVTRLGQNWKHFSTTVTTVFV